MLHWKYHSDGGFRLIIHGLCFAGTVGNGDLSAARGKWLRAAFQLCSRTLAMYSHHSSYGREAAIRLNAYIVRERYS